MLNIQSPKTSSKFALFQLAFRPFFLLAPIVAILSLLPWILYYSGWFITQNYWPARTMHSHEMIFGFVVAIISGFLLTAARTWTGLSTINGSSLLGLTLIWLAGRVAPWLPIPGIAVAIIDLSFLLWVVIALAIPILSARQYRNVVFIPILLLFGIANGFMHAQNLGYLTTGAHRGLYLALDLIILLITILGGRVIPFFTEKSLKTTINWYKSLELLSVLLMVFYIIIHQFNYQGALLSTSAFVVALMQLTRAIVWYRKAMWKVPLLWILHISHVWLLIGFVLMGLAALGVLSPLLAVHAITIGGISGMILGMIARVSLGHTGRLLNPPTWVVFGFYLISLSALVRVFIPLLMADFYSAAVVVSGFIWLLAMASFVINYFHILIQPKIIS